MNMESRFPSLRNTCGDRVGGEEDRLLVVCLFQQGLYCHTALRDDLNGRLSRASK